MYHSPYMRKFCSEPTPCEPYIDWRGVTSAHGAILADYDQINTHVLGEILPSLVILSLLTFELHVIELLHQK